MSKEMRELKMGELDEQALDIVAGGNTWAVLGPMNGQDIEAIGFLVLMGATKGAHDDLKAIMDGTHQVNHHSRVHH